VVQEYQEAQRELAREGNLKPKVPVSDVLVFMDDYYASMKTEIGVDPNYAVDPEDAQLDSVLKKLRPNSTVTSFRTYL
jgi:hypothetical protein